MKYMLQLILFLVLICASTLLHADDELSDEILSAGEDVYWDAAPGAFPHAIFPVKGGGHIISVFGDPRPNGRRHEGVDIAGARGTSILAAWPGVVVFSGWDPLGGWAVKIRHGNGLATYYAHMTAHSDLRVGAKVAQGDHVGAMGNTGDAKGGVVHLHFGIYNGRSAVNPLRFIPKKLLGIEYDIEG